MLFRPIFDAAFAFFIIAADIRHYFHFRLLAMRHC